MPICDENKTEWGSRRVYITLLLCQTIGLSSSSVLPNVAMKNGALGYMIAYVLTYVCFGIPLLYMEMIVSQFTGRDCLSVWKSRACLSHIGYILVLWQIIITVYNHIVVSFLVYYFIISFQTPISYYTCGPWATSNCDILINNYTVNEDCIRSKDDFEYCEELYKTFPEFLYWRYGLLGVKQKRYYVAWRVCLASGFVCVAVYLSCFKRKRSLQCFITTLAIYPTIGYAILMTGSMLQKGFVMKFQEALDYNFSIFIDKLSISNIIHQVVYTLSIGSGITFNLAASSPFRSPCYANTVITIVIGAAFTILTICTTVMMSCPYSYEYSTSPSYIMNIQLSFMFEKLPILLKEFTYRSFWLILLYSSNAVLGLRTTVVLFFNLLELAATRNSVVAKYPGVVTFSGTVFLFLITVPLLTNVGINVMTGSFRRLINLISTFVAMIECIVFVIWYGLDRFAEDVHFMQGIQVKSYLKISWTLSTVILGYTFCSEIHHQKKISKGILSDTIGWILLIINLSAMIVIAMIKLVVAAFKKKIGKMTRLDPTWGPRNEVLQRSRAMFTTQAMTKEYMYRQYHLQAGILARQKRSNIRTAESIPN